MSDYPDSLLRQIDAMSGRIAEAAVELKRQVALLEVQGAALARRMDRVAERLERTERRLEGAP